MATAREHAAPYPGDDIPPLGYRPPPTNIEAEQGLLGAILLSNRAFDGVAPFLKPEHFADPVHGRIFDAIGRLREKGMQANPITLAAMFDADGTLADRGGHVYLARLAASVITTLNASQYGRIILDCHQRRMAIQTAAEIAADAYAVDLERTGAEVVADAITRLESLGRDGPFRFQTAREVRIAAVEAMKVDLPCTSTGYERLDKAMGGGLYAGKMYGIMARMKAGKTLMGSAIAHNATRSGDRVLYIAGEMGAAGIEQRRWAAEIGHNSLAFLDRRQQRGSFLAQAADSALTATDRLIYLSLPAMTFEKLRRACAQYVTTYPDAKGIVLDYLQLVKGAAKGQSSASFMDDVAQWIADFCNERMIWSVVLAQENQDGNVRGGEGLKLACDMAFELARSDDGNGKDAWLNMIATRYTPWIDVGRKEDPAFRLETAAGPYYREIPALVTEEDASKL